MKPGFDPLLQAYGGMMSVTGRPEDPPTFCGASINDKATGMFCALGALAALRMRDKTGKGCLVDTSLFDSAVHWVEGGLNSYLANGNVPQRHGTGGNVIVPYQLFDTADLPLCLAPGNDRLWARCAQVLGHPEWGTDPRFAKTAQRVANKDALLPMIAAVMRTRPRAEWLAAFDKAGVPCSWANTPTRFLADPDLEARTPRVLVPVRIAARRHRRVLRQEALAGNEVDLEPDAVGILEDDVIVTGCERAIERAAIDVRAHGRELGRHLVDILAAARADAEVMEADAVLREALA